MPKRRPPPVEVPLEPASVWLEQNAKFSVPRYEPPSESRTSSRVQDVHVSFVCPNPPTLAFYDPQKAERFIDALDNALQNRLLQASPMGDETLTNSQVLYIFEKLFDPLCKEKDGILLDEWRRISSEATCNLLTHNALLHALKSVTFRLFGKQIYTKIEPLQPNVEQGAFDGTRINTLKEKVNFALYEEDTDLVILLVEGKTHLVLRGLAILFTGETFAIDMRDQSGSGRKILNKLIYYMNLWNIGRLVVTSFQEAYIIELHELGSEGVFLSYSDMISQETDGSKLFRAMLGMILVTLDEADLEEFDANAAYETYMQSRRANAAARARGSRRRRDDGGGGGGGGGDGGSGPPPDCPSGGGRGFGSNKKSGGTSTKSSGSRKTTSGTGRNGTMSTGKRGTKRGYKETVEEPISADDANGIISSRITRATSKLSMEPEHQAKGGRKTSVIRLIGSLQIGGLETDQMEFECDALEPFPSLPTSARVPCLKILEKGKGSATKTEQAVIEGTTGIVYLAVLQNLDGSDIADESDKPTLAIKVIDASKLTYDEYINSFEDLINEYKTYYLLALAKRAGRFNHIIDKFTPTCYGLYQAKVGSHNVFVLVLDYAGTVDLNGFWKWSGSDKHRVMQSLLALHSLGLYHGDPEERNVGVHRDNSADYTFRFFDFGNSHWHNCHGITECEELKLSIRDIYDMQEPPWDPILFQERTRRAYALPFCNLEGLIDGVDVFKCERVVLRLGRLARKYAVEYGE